eukprot:4133318-Amphidinium_carterae.1
MDTARMWEVAARSVQPLQGSVCPSRLKSSNCCRHARQVTGTHLWQQEQTRTTWASVEQPPARIDLA